MLGIVGYAIYIISYPQKWNINTSKDYVGKDNPEINTSKEYTDENAYKERVTMITTGYKKTWINVAPLLKAHTPWPRLPPLFNIFVFPPFFSDPPPF